MTTQARLQDHHRVVLREALPVILPVHLQAHLLVHPRAHPRAQDHLQVHHGGPGGPVLVVGRGRPMIQAVAETLNNLDSLSQGCFGDGHQPAGACRISEQVSLEKEIERFYFDSVDAWST